MSWRIDDGNITMTRGDTPRFGIGIRFKDINGEYHPYEPLETDEVIFAMMDKGTGERVLTKIIPNDNPILIFKEGLSRERGDS